MTFKIGRCTKIWAGHVAAAGTTSPGVAPAGVTGEGSTCLHHPRTFGHPSENRHHTCQGQLHVCLICIGPTVHRIHDRTPGTHFRSSISAFCTSLCMLHTVHGPMPWVQPQLTYPDVHSQSQRLPFSPGDWQPLHSSLRQITPATPMRINCKPRFTCALHLFRLYNPSPSP